MPGTPATLALILKAIKLKGKAYTSILPHYLTQILPKFPLSVTVSVAEEFLKLLRRGQL